MGALAQQLGADLGRPQRSRGVSGEERVAHAGGEDHDAALLEVPDGPAPDVGLGHLGHGQRAQHPGGLALLLERVLQRQRVDHGAEHAHGVGGGAVHAAALPGRAAPDVAAADHDGELEAAAVHGARHLLGHALDGGGVDGLVGRGGGERLARHLEDDPARFSHVAAAPQAPMTTCANATMRAEPSMPAIVCFSSFT